MFPHKINGNFLHIREARQAQKLLSPRRETKFSLPEAKGAAFPWLPRSRRCRGSIPASRGEGRGLCGHGEPRGSTAKAKEPLMGGGKLGRQLFSHRGLIIFFYPF